MLNLKFTALRVANIERELDTSIFEAIQKISIATILVIVKHGLGLKTDEEADEVLSKYLKGEGTIQDLMVEIVEAFQDGGFFPRTPETEQAIKQLREQLSVSTKSGKSTKS